MSKIELTAEERAQCERMGNRESDVLAMKRAQARGRPVNVEMLARAARASAADDWLEQAEKGDPENENAPPPPRQRPYASFRPTPGERWPGTEDEFRKQCAETGADPDKAVAKFRAAGGSFEGDDEERENLDDGGKGDPDAPRLDPGLGRAKGGGTSGTTGKSPGGNAGKALIRLDVLHHGLPTPLPLAR